MLGNRRDGRELRCAISMRDVDHDGSTNRLSLRTLPPDGHVLVPVMVRIFLAHRSPVIVCGALSYAGLERLQHRYGHLIVRRFGIADL